MDDRRPLIRRLDAVDWSFLIFLALVALALPGIRGSSRDLDYAGNAWRFLERCLPPDLTVLPEVGVALLETARIAVVATAFAALLSLPLGIAAARSLAPRWVAWPARLFLNGVRSVPALVWAVLAVAIVGPNALAGCLALTAYSIGYLAKFAAESIDSADPWPAQALRALDANAVQAFRWGLWPQLRAQLMSHGLWMLEYNLRSAAIVGYVGAGGIGLLLHSYQEYGDWQRFSSVLLVILLLVTALDALGQRLRRAWTGTSAADP
ncbi:MAG: phosphonate ABC transporter, permease protein PhnE [Planctomycetota bacterium]|nr:phosphonate ABC transporter, permease protein PhnE [Planctomycetota bacterium]MCX8039815.1 phosphonate ABC transporter, permease protein PhnE [Planctomycetota bacterium]MDW8372854.1 phosphonate ABC transporter, permease protein PhnE [Planctomycetota bacterium]